MNAPWSRKEVIGNATLYLGDCLEILPTLPKVDAVITDPPFFHPVNHYVNARNAEPVKQVLSDLSTMKHFFRIVCDALDKQLSNEGAVYWFCDGQSYGHSFEALYPHFKRVRPLIWDKLTSFNGYTWRHQHELIAWGEREKSPRIPTGDGDILKCRAVPVDERVHPAQKPIDLLEMLIKKTPPGAVLDPFMGSGSTGLACQKLDRAFIGVEMEQKYFDIACERIENAQRQLSIFPGDDYDRVEMEMAQEKVTL